MSEKSSAQTFVKGATVLAVAGILSRAIGLFYKVPLYRMVGSYGNGIYGNVTNIYNMLLMVSTVGMPVAISKMISEAMATDDYYAVRQTYRVSMASLLILGGAATLFLLFGSDAIIAFGHWPRESYPALMAVAFAPFVIAICSAYRGFFQGMQLMNPTAISQIWEQVVRVGLGVVLCYLFVAGGYGTGMGVAGAILGATVGGVIAAGYLINDFLKYKGEHPEIFAKDLTPTKTWQQALKRLMLIAVPVTLTSVIVSLYATINSFIYIPRLGAAGIDKMTATMMFGDYTNVDMLINLPLVISANLAVAMIPAISEAFAVGDHKTVVDRIDLAMRLIIIVGFPSCVGLSVLSQGIFDLLFPGSEYGPGLMQVFAYITIFMMLSNIFQSILQAIDRFRVPLITLAGGTVIFLVSGWFAMAVPALNIYGMGLAFGITFVYQTVVNYFFVKRYTGMRIHWVQTIIKPSVASALMGLAVFAVYHFVHRFSGNFIALTLAIIVGVAVYAIVLIVIGGIDDNTLEALPGSRYIVPVVGRVLAVKDKIMHR